MTSFPYGVAVAPRGAPMISGLCNQRASKSANGDASCEALGRDLGYWRGHWLSQSLAPLALLAQLAQPSRTPGVSYTRSAMTTRASFYLPSSITYYSSANENYSV